MADQDEGVGVLPLAVASIRDLTIVNGAAKAAPVS